MRKLLVALMIVAFAATAFADVKLSGSYKVRGNYHQNLKSVDDNSDDKQMFYDHDLDVWLKASTDKDTFFKAKLELADEQWGTKDGADVTSNEASTNEGVQGNEIELERAWLGHNFGVAKLEVGIMDGGGWSYVFGNDVSGKFRVKATIPAGPGKIVAFTQKNKEIGYGSAVKDADKDDSDSYFVGYTGKIGSIAISPSFTYTADGSVDDTDQDVDTTNSKFDMGIGGSFGAVGFESEFIYLKVETEGDNDPATYGAYLNVFGKVAGATVGFITAYSSVDDDNGNVGFNMGADFDDSYVMVLGDYEYVAEGLPGMWANIVYAEYNVNSKLALSGSFAYAMSNYDKDKTVNGMNVKDAKAYEIDLGMTYKITKALKYGVSFGYAKVDLDTGTDPDAAMLLEHYLKISF